MPRRLRTRATRGPDEDLDPAIASYLITGDLATAARDRKARGLPVVLLWRERALKPLWDAHRDGLLAEAKRRGIRQTYGERELDAWTSEA